MRGYDRIGIGDQRNKHVGDIRIRVDRLQTNSKPLSSVV